MDSTIMGTSLIKLQKKLGYTFHDTMLMHLALTHRSCGRKNNERLEFLGDSILNFVISEVLYEKFMYANEGQLSRLRARLVRGSTLAAIAQEFLLSDFVHLGPGEAKSGSHCRESILADLVESLVGAIYLDGGITPSRTCILHWFHQRLAHCSIDAFANKDPKTKLQEWLQSQQKPLPHYKILCTNGQAHHPIFQVQCYIPGHSPMIGEGHNRRSAEQQAAQQLLKVFGIEGIDK